MEAEFKAGKFNPIDMMVGSGARGNMTQMSDRYMRTWWPTLVVT